MKVVGIDFRCFFDMIYFVEFWAALDVSEKKVVVFGDDRIV